MDWGGANSRFLGLVSVWAARSFDQTTLRPSVIKRIRQIDVKYITHITSFGVTAWTRVTAWTCMCDCVNMHVWAPEVDSPLNSYLYVHWILDFKQLLLLLLLKQSKNNNSQGPDKLNIRHLKHIGPLGLAFLTSMFKTALNKNIIPHTWKLANIIPIPKPNKDTDKGTSYKPISLLSVIAKTLEKTLLPYLTSNIPNTPMQHGYKTQHSTVTALHTLNNNVAKGFNQMAPPARIITVALDMSKSFDTINIHTLIRKLLQTNFPELEQSLSSSQTTSRDAKPTLHIEITHPNNVNLKTLCEVKTLLVIFLCISTIYQYQHIPLEIYKKIPLNPN